MRPIFISLIDLLLLLLLHLLTTSPLNRVRSPSAPPRAGESSRAVFIPRGAAGDTAGGGFIFHHNPYTRVNGANTKRSIKLYRNLCNNNIPPYCPSTALYVKWRHSVHFYSLYVPVLNLPEAALLRCIDSCINISVHYDSSCILRSKKLLWSSLLWLLCMHFWWNSSCFIVLFSI